jgi:hypothetical protein
MYAPCPAAEDAVTDQVGWWLQHYVSSTLIILEQNRWTIHPG